MKMAVALGLGMLSGLLLGLLTTLFMMDIYAPRLPTGAGWVPSGIVFGVGWLLTSWLLIARASTIGRMFGWGFLLGAMEWLVLGVTLIVSSSMAVSAASNRLLAGEADDSGIAVESVMFGGALLGSVAGPLCLGVGVLCLAGWAVMYLATRDRPTGARMGLVPCPRCAELIQPAAQMCRFCGLALTAAAIGAPVGE